ncbi:uncharacterized protein LOC121711187 [Alosa sapidissima]|uniref:uncharacterized protein LOC121711187 n=1 Tax=Alosa sapidissima TaxID=34773 RepID=UPI001C08DE51|nr:uncharacterized protein LOC121711187 [Alosa sapidissima]
MAKLHNPIVGLLLTVLLLLQDAYGNPAVFSTKGGAATLPCANVQYHRDCSSTTWIYSRNSSTAAVEEVTLGKIRPENTQRAERLSLLPNCSLHITDVTTEDAGLYTCQQYPNGQKYGEDAQVHLSVLHTASRLAEKGLDVIIFCLLNIFDGCNSLGQDRHLNLQWLNAKGVVQNSDNVMIGRVTQCDINLTLKHPVLPQRTWRCQLTAGGHVQASVSHTIGETTRSTPKRTTTTTVTTTSTTTKATITTIAVAAAATTTATSQQTSFPFIFISAVVAGLAVCLIIIPLMVRWNRTREKSSGGGKTPQQNTGVADANRSSTVQPSVVSVESGDETQCADTVLYSSVNKSANPAAKLGDPKEPGDVTYAALAHHPRTQALPPATQHEDSVTYATVHIMHKD